MAVGPLISTPRQFDDAANVLRALSNVLARPARAFLEERERWPLWLPVGFGAGIAMYFAAQKEPSPETATIAAVAGLLSSGAAVWSANTVLRVLCAVVAVVGLGFAHAKFRSDRLAAPLISHKMGPLKVAGLIDSAEAHGKGMRVVLSALYIAKVRGRTPARIRVSIRAADDALVPGRWVQLTALLMPPPAPAAPGDYDFGRAAWFDRIGAVGFAYGRASLIAPLRAPSLLERTATEVAALRWRMTERIRTALPGSTGGIAAALITGERGSISDEDEDALRDSGLAHVLAIAGLHMGLVALGIFWVLRAILAAIPPLALNFPIKKWAAAATLLSATFYLVISGAGTPSTRAYVMLSTMLIAILFDRPALSMRSVALAAMVILAFRPESLLEPGFQMSFAAVASLVAVAEWDMRRKSRKEREPKGRFAHVSRYLRGIAITSFVGSIATAPYVAYHFDRSTHYAVLGNLLAMPVMGFVTMPAAALAIIAMPFGLEAWPLKVMGFGIGIMLRLGRFVSGLPGAVSPVAAWPLWAVVLISLGGLWILLWRRRWRWLGLAPLAAGFAACFFNRGPDILIARDGMTVAVRADDGTLKLIRNPKDRYSAQEWLKRDGDTRSFADAIASAADRVRCDGYGCIIHARDGSLIAAASRIEALAEDCSAAKIVISAVPVYRACRGPGVVIDRFDIMRAGGYAIWLGKRPRIETVSGERGARPWNPEPPKREAHQYRRINPTSFP